MSDIWDLPDEAKAQAIEAGYTEAQVEAVIATRKANFEALKAASMHGLTEEEFATYYQDRYGIDHQCRCAEDKFTGNTMAITKCSGEFHNMLVDAYQELLIERDALRAQVEELGGTV